MVPAYSDPKRGTEPRSKRPDAAAAPDPVADFLDAARRSGLVDPRALDTWVAKARNRGKLPDTAPQLASLLVQHQTLTGFQAEQLLAGRWRNFVIHKKYRVLNLLGAGRAGGVFLCEHVDMKRRVAIKMIPPGRLNQESLQRFMREAAMASLTHPNLVHALDFDNDGQIYFLVMEYIEGIDLLQLIRQRGPLDFPRAANYIGQAAAGLQHAFACGWIHRDVKPSNLLLDRHGKVRITDMGVARLMSDAEDELTRQVEAQQGEQTILGSVDFISPEQAYDCHDVDIQTDVYSLGATFYYLLTGRAPVPPGTVPEKLLHIQRKTIMPARSLRPDIPMDLDAVLNRMMAKRPEMRYESPQAVIDALKGCGCYNEKLQPMKLPPTTEEKMYEFQVNKFERKGKQVQTPTPVDHSDETSTTHKKPAPPTPPPSAAPTSPFLPRQGRPPSRESFTTGRPPSREAFTPPPSRRGSMLWLIIALAIGISAGIAFYVFALAH
jgi:serine/threonine protein kinase